MIRNRTVTVPALQAWLVLQNGAAAAGNYQLRLWKDDPAQLAGVQEELVAYFQEALDDARMRLRRGFSDDLSPFVGPPEDPAAGFPSNLNRLTLQGYLGETLAGLTAEHLGANGHADWAVPAFLFRFHSQEFQHLEPIRQAMRQGVPFQRDAKGQRRPGRTGDDCLAFRMNDAGEITDVLVLEAKCLTKHRTSTVKEAHRSVSDSFVLTSGIRELIELLADYPSEAANRWRVALLKLWRDPTAARRHDGVVYACGRSPRRRHSWLPSAAPHSKYTGGRRLEAMEFHFSDLTGLVDSVYRG